MRTLCLNVTYEPLGFLPQERAVALIYEDKVELIESGEGQYRSPSGITIPEPVVIKLKRYIKMPRTLRECISSRVLFARDNHTCQYCGKHKDDLKGKRNRLTIDHIKPKSQGGPHHWENVVTACYICNIKKRNRTPTQANMKFVDLYKNRSPKKPHFLVFNWGGRVTDKQAEWIKAYYKVDSLSEEMIFDVGESGTSLQRVG